MMASLATHQANRAAAGAAYAAAAKTLVDAWVELHALDQLSNSADVAANSISVWIGPNSGFPSLYTNEPITGRLSTPQTVGTFNGVPNLPYHTPFLAHAAADTGAGAAPRAASRLAALMSTYSPPGMTDTSSPAENNRRATNRGTIAGLRTAAGAAYAAATGPLASAYVELGAYDMTLENSNVGGGPQTTFSGPMLMPAHADFVPSPPSGPLGDRIRTRFLQLLAS